MIFQGVLCGGSGTRLGFLSYKVFSKQFILLLAALRVHAPAIFDVRRWAMCLPQQDGLSLRPDDDRPLAACRNQSFDYTEMERGGNISVFTLSCVRSDAGSWHFVAQRAEPDPDSDHVGSERQNANHLRTCNTYIHASGQRPVGMLCTQDLLGIDTPDTLPVADSAYAEVVKEMLVKLEMLDGPQSVLQCCAELWVVVGETAEVTNDDKVLVLRENRRACIPVGQTQRLDNSDNTSLEIVEVRRGLLIWGAIFFNLEMAMVMKSSARNSES